MNIKHLCSFLGYSKQAYYKRSMGRKSLLNAAVLEYVIERRKVLPLEGARKLYIHLNRDTDHSISRHTLEDILRQNELITVRKRKPRSMTNSLHSKPVSGNYLRQNFPKHIFQVMVSDITYLKTKDHEWYLTAIMDLYARLILSYCLSPSLSNDGLLRAFLLIVKNHKIFLRGCIFHSDRGTQYCSNSFRELAGQYSVILSNSRNGNPYDNACMERFFSTLKNEYLLGISFSDSDTLAMAVRDAVYSYNNLRLHTSLNYRTPMDVFMTDLKQISTY